jgi:hypothetical protein
MAPRAKEKPFRPSKPSLSRKPRSDIYKRCKAEWESNRQNPDKGSGDYLIDPPELEMQARPFLATLKRLGYVTQDQRCFELHSALVTGDLVDHKSGRWTSRLNLAHPDTQWICDAIDQYLAAGVVTQREVIAEIVAEFNISGNSFHAAWVRVNRRWQEHRKRQLGRS